MIGRAATVTEPLPPAPATLAHLIAQIEAQRATLGDALTDAMLAPALAQLAAWQAGTETAEDRRRYVTVLFADVSGFTALAEKLDAEDVGELMHTLWARLDAVIVAHGGQIDKHIGDAVMALWGATTAREDDAARAVSAALAMQAELRAAADTLRYPLHLRIGINSGPIVLGTLGTSGEVNALGDTVNSAARLEHAAPIDGVLIAQSTYRAVAGLFDALPLAPLTVKGKSEPLRTYRVTRARPRAFRPPTRGVEGVSPPLIGRAPDLQALHTAWQAARTQQAPHSVTVIGDAGVGKSRLLAEFEAALADLPAPPALLHGRADADSAHVPYALWRDVFTLRYGLAEVAPAPAAPAAFVRGILTDLGASPEAESHAHFLGQLLGFAFETSPHLQGILEDSTQIRTRALHALAQVCAAIAQPSGAVLILEDIHWADDASLDALTDLAHSLPAAALLILAAARPTLDERRPHWRTHLPAHTALPLAPLTPDACTALVTALLYKVADASAPPATAEAPPSTLTAVTGAPALIARIAHSAEGNPLYAEALLNMLIDQRVIVPQPPDGAHWHIVPERLSSAYLPPTLAATLQARLDALPANERALLQRAAVIGRVFWDAPLIHLGAVANTLPTALAALVRRGLISPNATSPFADTHEYQFYHSLVREAAYESVLMRRRRTYHAQVADWLSAHSAERADLHAGLIADHYERAVALTQAGTWYGRAAEQAARTYAPEAAVGHYRKALALYANPPHELLHTWLAGLAEAYGSLANDAEAHATYDSLRLSAEQLHDAASALLAWQGLARTQRNQGDNRASLASARHAEALARAAHSPPSALARTLASQGWALFRLGETAAADACTRAALALCPDPAQTPTASSADLRTRAGLLNLYNVICKAQGRFAAADEALRAALALYTALGDQQRIGVIRNNLGVTDYRRGDFTAAIAHYTAALETTRRIGDREGEHIGLSNLGGARVGLGAYVEAEADLRAVLAVVEPGSWLLSETLGHLAQALLGQGRAAEACTAAENALARGEQSGNADFISAAWRALATARAALSDVPGAEAAFTAGLRVAAEHGLAYEHAHLLRAWAACLRVQGATAHAAELWQEARAAFVALALPLEVARLDHERPPET